MDNKKNLDGKVEDFNLDNSQLNAIALAAKLGRQLQQIYPQIAQDYINGLFAPQIIEKYDLMKKFGYTEYILITAIRYALKGYEWRLRNTTPYQGLIQDPNLIEQLRSEHLSHNGKVIAEKLRQEGRGIVVMSTERRSELGKIVYEKKLGVHSFTPEQRSYYGRKEYLNRIGLFSRNPEQHSQDSRKGGLRLAELRKGFLGLDKIKLREVNLLSLQAQGKVPYSQKEREHAYWLSQQPQNILDNSRIGVSYIAEELNLAFHEGRKIRTPHAVGTLLSEINKKGDVNAQKHYELSDNDKTKLEEILKKSLEAKITSRGLTPWTDEEFNCLYNLSLNPDYQGRGSLNKLSETINDEFHNGKDVRSRMSIGAVLRRLRKKNE